MWRPDPFFHIFISVFIDSEAIADELNPLTISHIASTISFRPIGRYKRGCIPEEEPKTANKHAANHNGTPIRPQPDNHRGMSFD